MNLTENQMKSFSLLMNRLDKAKLETVAAQEKETKLLIMVRQRAKFLGIGKK